MTCLRNDLRVCGGLPDVRVPRTDDTMSQRLGRALIGVATLAAVSFTVSIAAQHDLRLLRGAELGLPQGPGSDIQASVLALGAGDQRPQAQSGVVIEQIVRGGPADHTRAGEILDTLLATE